MAQSASNRSVLVLPGDGIGPEIMGEVARVIEFFDKRRIASFDISEGLVGGSAYDADRCDLGPGTGSGRGIVRFGRRPEMGKIAVRGAARTRPPASAQGDGSVR